MSKGKAKSEKKPKHRKAPNSLKDIQKKKVAASASTPVSSTNLKPNWKFGSLDLECLWGFSKQGSKKDLIDVIEKLKNFEGQTWGEIDRNKNSNHSSPIKNMSQPARKRLKELNMDVEYLESLYSLRLTGKERIWGIREGADFYFLWWDPEHEVYPSKLKHT